MEKQSAVFRRAGVIPKYRYYYRRYPSPSGTTRVRIIINIRARSISYKYGPVYTRTTCTCVYTLITFRSRRGVRVPENCRLFRPSAVGGGGGEKSKDGGGGDDDGTVFQNQKKNRLKITLVTIIVSEFR